MASTKPIESFPQLEVDFELEKMYVPFLKSQCSCFNFCSLSTLGFASAFPSRPVTYRLSNDTKEDEMVSSLGDFITNSLAGVLLLCLG